MTASIAPAPVNFAGTSSIHHNSGLPSTTPQNSNQTRFGDGGCTTCLSCPCSCFATILSAGLLAAAGLGLVKFSPQIVAKAKSLISKISPEKIEAVKQAFRKTFLNRPPL